MLSGTWGGRVVYDPASGKPCDACDACQRRIEAERVMQRARQGGSGGELLGAFSCRRLADYERNQKLIADRAREQESRVRTL
jgi:hypothetical protein